MNRSSTARYNDVLIAIRKVFAMLSLVVQTNRVEILNHFVQSQNSIISRYPWVCSVHFHQSFLFRFQSFVYCFRHCAELIVDFYRSVVHHGLVFGQTDNITVASCLTITQTNMNTFVAKKSIMLEAI